MDIMEIIDFYYRTNTPDFYIYKIHGEYLSAFSKDLKDQYYNHLMPIGKTDPVELLKSQEFKKYGRKPVVYVLPISNYYEQKLFGVNNIANDTWMKFKYPNPPKINVVKDFSLKIIDKDYMDEYLNLFSHGFQGGVYGTLPPEYLIVEKLCFQENESTPNKHLFAMAFYNDKPVGVVRAIIENDKAFIFAFAIPKEYRHGGVTANVLGIFIINEIFNRGGKNIFLQTEAYTALERMYTQNGFERLFVGRYYGAV